jgi:hypothetical protein
MEWLLIIPLLALALYVVLLMAVSYARVGHWHLLTALASLEEDFQRGAAWSAQRLERRAERSRLERRFAMVAGESGGVDHGVVEAARQMPIIRQVLDEELPATIVRCVRMHRLAARAVGARHIREIAHEPECAGLRYRVIGLASAAIDALERYPLLVEDETVMANLITLRSRIVPICNRCPYLEHAVADAPLRCPTAITARIDPERCRDEIKEP